MVWLKIFFFIILISLISLNLIYAQTNVYNSCEIYGNCNIPTSITNINYSTVNTNNSQYLQGLTPQQVANLFNELDPNYFSNPSSYCNSTNGFCASGNPFDQSLNTTDNVTFNNLTVGDTTNGNIQISQFNDANTLGYFAQPLPVISGNTLNLFGQGTNSNSFYIDDTSGVGDGASNGYSYGVIFYPKNYDGVNYADIGGTTTWLDAYGNDMRIWSDGNSFYIGDPYSYPPIGFYSTVEFKGQTTFNYPIYSTGLGLGSSSSYVGQLLQSPWGYKGTHYQPISGNNTIVPMLSAFGNNGNTSKTGFLQGSDFIVLDDSNLGSQMLTNANGINGATSLATDFPNWTFSGSWSLYPSSGVKRPDGSGTMSQSASNMATPFKVGHWYQIFLDINGGGAYGDGIIITAGGVILNAHTQSGGQGVSSTFVFRATDATQGISINASNGVRFQIGGAGAFITVKEVTGGNLDVNNNLLVVNNITAGNVNTLTNFSVNNNQGLTFNYTTVCDVNLVALTKKYQNFTVKGGIIVSNSSCA